MKKALLLVLLTAVVLSVPQTGIAYYGMESIPYNIVLSANTLEEIICQAALIFHGSGYWEDAEVFTAGCIILEDRIDSNRHYVSAAVATCRYDIDEGVPQAIGVQFYPAQLTLDKQPDGKWALISYLYPEDGHLYSKQCKELFSDDVYCLLMNTESKNKLFQYAGDNALSEAKKFMSAQNGECVYGVWRKVLKPGSNTRARELLRQHKVWNDNYPCYEGFVIWNEVLYQLSVEEEQSYSGKLRFAIYDQSGKIADSVVQVQENNIVYQYE